MLASLAGMAVGAWAVPAHPGLNVMRQPDGTTVTLQLVGDEFYHFTRTSDGYTIVPNAEGGYEYAVMRSGSLTASGVLAHDAGARTQGELDLLAQVGKNLQDGQQHQRAKAQIAQRNADLAPHRANLNNYRGLVVLVNLKNKTFRRTDAQAFYQSQTNDRNYTGYTDQSTGNWVSCTGSVRDYFNDNSMGQFDPQFDVVGPVTANYNVTQFNGTSNARDIFQTVIDAIKGSVDFSKYDSDNDGVVDMIYFIVAGYGSNYGGNNSGYLWPHAWAFSNYTTYYNGKRLGRYACSVELDGFESYPSSVTIGGIGTMCHEFSHVLGVMDHYDTDYDDNGLSNHPADWDVMAGGSYFNNGRTPVGYTLFERYTMGFANPTVINAPGDYTLEPVNTSNAGYIIQSPVTREYFMLDNRQKTGWDIYLPGHGMLVWRVDSTNTDVWSSNKVNANPTHNYLEIIRAGQSSSASGSDPFPGTASVRTLNANTTPALVTWAGLQTEFGLANIAENNGIITFTVVQDGDVKKSVEDFERMPTFSTASATDVWGNFAKWNFTKCKVMDTPDNGGNGQKTLGMVSPSLFYLSEPLPATPYTITYHAYNPTSATAKYRVEYKDVGDTKWTTLQTDDVAAGTDQVISCSLNLEGNKIFRFSQMGGHQTQLTYVDDITFYYLGDEIPVHQGIDGDVNDDGVVDVTDVNVLIMAVLGVVPQETKHDMNGDGVVDVTDVNILISKILGN